MKMMLMMRRMLLVMVILAEPETGNCDANSRSFSRRVRPQRLLLQLLLILLDPLSAITS